MVYHITHHVFIDQTLVLLECIHQAFLSYPVNAPLYSGGFTIDIVKCLFCKEILAAACILQMCLYILLRL